MIHPHRHHEETPRVRAASLSLIAMISTANLVTLILLIRFLLSGHPISGGQRWSSDAVAVCFSDDDHLELDLVDAKATSSGVVIATYRTNV